MTNDAVLVSAVLFFWNHLLTQTTNCGCTFTIKQGDLADEFNALEEENKLQH